MFPVIVEFCISVVGPVAESPAPSIAVLPVIVIPSTDSAPSLWIAPPVPAAEFPMKSESVAVREVPGPDQTAPPSSPCEPETVTPESTPVPLTTLTAAPSIAGSRAPKIVSPSSTYRFPASATPSVKARCPSADASMKTPVSPSPSIVTAERRSISPSPTPPFPVTVNA